ncbi:MAG: hypothetical protein VX265_04510 [Myxococcota bacterium]|nr:hypothetical protein [Myxococcota bacterium]MEC8423148.1 hypothetical protein [Myxococcota bacterium]
MSDARPDLVPERDARTTPGWLRAPALVFCIALGSLFFSAFLKCKDDFGAVWLDAYPWVHWMSNWSMFTPRNRWQKAVDIEFQSGGAWHPVDGMDYFPTRWESGFRWDRTSFRNSSVKMRTLGAAFCARMTADDAAPVPDRVRFIEVKWRKTRGQLAQPRDRWVRYKLLHDHRCGDPPPSGPQGFRLADWSIVDE